MSRSRKFSAWEGPVPPEIMQCGDMFVTQRFKKLVREANEVLYMHPGKRREDKIKEMNKRLDELVNEAKRILRDANEKTG